MVSSFRSTDPTCSRRLSISFIASSLREFTIVIQTCTDCAPTKWHIFPSGCFDAAERAREMCNGRCSQELKKSDGAGMSDDVAIPALWRGRG